MGSCSIPVAAMPPQLGTRTSISGFSLLLLLCFFWTVQSSRFLSHVLFPLSVKSHCRGDSDQLLISVISKIVQWPWDNDMEGQKLKLSGYSCGMPFSSYIILEPHQSYFKIHLFYSVGLFLFKSPVTSLPHTLRWNVFSLSPGELWEPQGTSGEATLPQHFSKQLHARKCALLKTHTLVRKGTGYHGALSPAQNFLLCPPLHLQLLIFLMRKGTSSFCFYYSTEMPIGITRILRFAKRSDGFLSSAYSASWQRWTVS